MITPEYIAGFFDADGCITLVRADTDQHKSPQVSFHNNEKGILQDIRTFFGFGTFSTKKPRKETHKVSYDLKMTHRRAIEVLNIIYPFMRHPIKRHKARLVMEEYISITPRRGHYTEEQLKIKEDFDKRFFSYPSL